MTAAATPVLAHRTESVQTYPLAAVICAARRIIDERSDLRAWRVGELPSVT